MKRIVSTLLLGASLGTGAVRADDGALTRGQDGCGGCQATRAAERGPLGGALEIDDVAKQLEELERRLGEVLVVDENGRIVLRDEFAESLPFPKDRVQAMLAQFVELDGKGKIRLKDPEQVRPYLPMIQRFLSDDAMARVRELQKLPPEQRREALQRMMQEQGQGPRGAAPAPGPRGEARPGPRPEPRPAPRPEPRPGADSSERRHHAERGAPDDRVHQDVMKRLDEIERSLHRIERMLAEQGRTAPHPRRGEGRARPGQRRPMGEVLERFGTWRRGMQKLAEIMEPGDVEALMRTFDKLRGDLGPGALRDRGELLQKLQGALEPKDMVRMLEVFSEFMGSEEGRAMMAELERSVERLEGFMNSERGQRLGEAFGRLGERLGEGGGEGGMREQLERLVRGRDRAEPGRRGGDERKPAPDRQDRSTKPRVPDGARLY